MTMAYVAPVTEQLFVLETCADLGELGPELAAAILEESGKLASGVFAPLNQVGDRVGAQWNQGDVTLPAGFREGYRAYVEGGWGSLAADPAHGGQGLSFAIATAVQEQLTSANMAFSLCMILSQGAISALEAHASEDLKQIYLGNLVSGEWTGTMNLTEPQAGSDVGALRTRATKHSDGSYRIKGSKIFISWGEHDCAENIVHLVLARLPDAPAGTRGISLFIVPKFLVNADGSLGERNDVHCASIEHKLGIHASPTCTMSFGDEDRCVGYLVGDENAGMKAMFTMMNHARINVGLQGVAIAERATQAAVAYARERVQFGRIIEHADVRRMLMTMKATTEAVRALTYCNAAAVDGAHATGDEAAQGLADLLTPVTKAWATDMGVEVASLAMQVHGGMGFIEETGVAQYLRDIRIAPIYEGTNGIQAIDLVNRKLSKGHWPALFARIEAFAAELPDTSLMQALEALRRATGWMLDHGPRDREAGAVAYLRAFGIMMGGYLLALQAAEAARRQASGGTNQSFLAAKQVTARFFASQILPQAIALAEASMAGEALIFAMPEEDL